MIGTADETVLRPADVARKLKVHVATVSRWILKGVPGQAGGERIRLDAIRIPGGWRILPSDLERFLRVVRHDHATATEAPIRVPTETCRVSRHRAAELEAERLGL